MENFRKIFGTPLKHTREAKTKKSLYPGTFIPFQSRRKEMQYPGRKKNPLFLAGSLLACWPVGLLASIVREQFRFAFNSIYQGTEARL